jgi:hypothetical protein
MWPLQSRQASLASAVDQGIGGITDAMTILEEMPPVTDAAHRLTEGLRETRGFGRRSAVTVTAVAATALVATAAYMWWRRHESIRPIEPRRWPAETIVPGTSAEPATAVGERDSTAFDFEATGGSGVPTTVDFEEDVAEVPEALEPTAEGDARADIESTKKPTAAEALDEEVVPSSGEPPVDEVVMAEDDTDTQVASGASPESMVMTEMPASDEVAEDEAAGATRPVAVDEPIAEQPHPSDQEQAATGRAAAEASQDGPRETQQPAIPRAPARSSLDPSTSGHRPEGRVTPRAPSQPLTQRFTVPSPRTKLPSTRRSPLP